MTFIGRFDLNKKKIYASNLDTFSGKMLSNPDMTIPFDDIQKIWFSAGTATHTIYEKGKSGLGRAVTGGIIAGGVGAIVGAITGHKSGGSITQTDDIGSVYLNLAKFPGETIVAHTRQQHDINRLAEFFTSSDPTAGLRQYKSLLDDGIITQAEFDAKKKQLLGL